MWVPNTVCSENGASVPDLHSGSTGSPRPDFSTPRPTTPSCFLAMLAAYGLRCALCLTAERASSSSRVGPILLGPESTEVRPLSSWSSLLSVPRPPPQLSSGCSVSPHIFLSLAQGPSHPLQDASGSPVFSSLLFHVLGPKYPYCSLAKLQHSGREKKLGLT